MAVSTTPDATGSYYRYAFSTGPNFPDYPKYGVWPHAYVATTREFDPADNCRFWYVNEYYQTTSARSWQTRIAAFRPPGCT